MPTVNVDKMRHQAWRLAYWGQHGYWLRQARSFLYRESMRDRTAYLIEYADRARPTIGIDGLASRDQYRGRRVRDAIPDIAEYMS